MYRCPPCLAVALVAGLWFGLAESASAWDYRTGLSGGWQQVSEREDDEELVSEQGLVAGLSAAAWITSGDWQIGIDGGAFGGKLDYDGATQSGAPLTTNTEWQGWHVGMGFERRFLVPVPVQIGGGLEYQYRDRHILSTDAVGGLKERYQTVWLGVRGAIHPTAFSMVEFNFGCAVASEVEVSFVETFDAADLALNDHCRARLAADFDIGKFGSKTVFLSPFVGWERYPVSDAERLTAGGSGVGSIYLPETELRTIGITLGVRGWRE